MSFESDFADLLNKTAKIYTKSKSNVNDFGESAFSLSTTINSLTCALQPVREELTFTLHGTTYVVRKVVYCEYREDINPGDMIEIDSVKYLIVSVGDDGGQEDHLKLYITRP
jgi:hypothetical protein